MIIESTGLAQVEEPVASAGVEDNTLQTSTAKPGTVEFVAALGASEATTITVPEVPVTTSALTEPVVGFVSAPSEMALPLRTNDRAFLSLVVWIYIKYP